MASSVRVMAGEIALIESPPEYTLAENNCFIVLIHGIPQDFKFDSTHAELLLNIKLDIFGDEIAPCGLHFHDQQRSSMLFFDNTKQSVPYSHVLSKVSIEIAKIMIENGFDTSSLVCYISGFKTKGQLFVYALCKCYGMHLSYIQKLSFSNKISVNDLNEKTLGEITEILKEDGIDINTIPESDSYGIIYSYSRKTKRIRHLSGIYDGRNEKTYLSFIFGI